ncbi:Coat F domain-containing protein [Anaerovirgula multivorans]|uniref:Coat F domain-containing protein n=1 Tax=Anaerovirgula multivorans TaxID=312168 RepID=A0A239AG45_9FIRM|nr:spore coat protein [Anaerovirgula multivorans]SNR94607.1 Coat F domain-containing protein [Anaerovirgula multivorans]
MAQLNQLELQNLRHLISNHQMMVSKLNTYAQQCQDQQVKQMFQQSAQSAQGAAQKLMTFL